MKHLRVLLLILISCLPARAGQGVTVERGDAGEADAGNRERLARTLYSHNFENIRDPDTGALLPESAALGSEGWPDFWEPVRAVGFPEYLIPAIRVEPDPSGFIPGAYRDLPNHALRLDFDGTRVGIRTKSPVPVNPSLAYQYSLFVRDAGLKGARIRAGVDWMRIDPAAAQVLRSDEVGAIGTGQEDWPVQPRRMLINDPPPAANAARLFFIVDRDPESIGGAYHGSVWLDDIELKPLPKIRIDAPRPPDESGVGRIIPVRYTGLFENIPDPNNPGYFRGRSYSRRVEITDVFGQPVTIQSADRKTVDAGDDGTGIEEVSFPRDKYGVYYFNIRLYDADDRLLTNVMRAVAVLPPEIPRQGMAMHSLQPSFGVSSGIVPDNILSAGGLLRRILASSGVKMTKIVPWVDSYAAAGQNDEYYADLVEEIRHLRSSGLGVSGIIRPPSAMFDGVSGLREAVVNRPDRLADIIAEAGRHLGLFMDGWQWGDDSDPGLSRLAAGEDIDAVVAALREFAGGMPSAGTAILGGGAPPAFPVATGTTQARLTEKTPADQLWPLAAPVFPWLYEPYYAERGRMYPPRRLSRLAPPPPADKLEEETRKNRRTGAWLSVEIPPANPHEPNASAEREQLEELLIRGVYAAVIRPEVVFLGELFDPAQGLLRRDMSGANTLETMARPAYIAAGTLSRFLEGAEYLGQIWLLPPFEAHAFRLPGSDESVIALWHNDSRDIVPLPRAQIANGPAMDLIDWAGNSQPLPSSIPVRRAPAFIRGLPASLLLTRMSMRINPDQYMQAVVRRQNQTLEMVNHMPRQTPALVRLQYAARVADGGMEEGWVVRPGEARLNLTPLSPQLEPGRFRYTVSPDPNSQIQRAGPESSDKAGRKIAQAKVSFSTTPPADMTVFLPFRLRSDLDVDVERLQRVDEGGFVTLQLKIRWFPSEADRRRGEIRVTPYYMKYGQMREPLPFPVTVKAQPPEMRGRPEAPFESVELRIPRQPRNRTLIGLDQADGSAFYLIDVTDYIMVD